MQPRRIYVFVGLIALLATSLSACSDTPAGGSQDRPKVTIMVGGLDKIIYLPAILTRQLGYFDEAGVDVTLSSEPSGVDAADELLVGQVQGVVGFYDHTIDLQGTGKSIESVVQFASVPGEVVVVDSRKAGEITSPADFKGRNIGVTDLGASTHFLTQYLAVMHGVPVDQFHAVSVGANNTFIAAMQHGQIDAGMTTEPTVSRLLKTGEAKILVDLRTADSTKSVLGGTYPAACLFMTTAWVNANADTVRKLAGAFVKTLHYIHTHSAAEIAAKMPSDYYAGDKDLYLKALDASLAMFTTDGMMPADGPSTVLRVLSAFDKNIQGKNIDLTKTYTSAFICRNTSSNC